MSKPWQLQVSDNRRFVVHSDGTPFFWLGDTAWELFHKLNREEAELYLVNRAERKFNVIQAVALAELEGLTVPNAYGRLPLRADGAGGFDPTQPDTDAGPGGYSYWDHVDYVIGKAEELGMYVALLPTWGDKFYMAWGKGPEVFDSGNARVFGKWIGERYRDRPNVIWVMNGDRPLTKRRHFEVVQAMAEGVREAVGRNHLMTFHPPGNQTSSHHVHEEDWLDFNMIQSGHGDKRDNYSFVTADYGLQPVKPTLDGEPCYEDHPIGFHAPNGYFDEADVRKAAYYAVFAGAFGHTYGHHSIWSMTTEPADYFIMTWQNAILRPGAAQMQHVRALIESRPFLERVPDQSLLESNYAGANYMTATRGERYAFIYSPNGLPIGVRLGVIEGSKVAASWYDPRTGETSAIDVRANEGTTVYVPPLAARGSDWVLVLDGQQ
ncbi:glycoside hydrolase family 140 protein [Cohnella sp. GCM10027633]|uniref:glycoside hydrolase family 140 protein n=1 Tax=unclassified Cohnella TaxID=2636738 RepID=UPI00363B09D6